MASYKKQIRIDDNLRNQVRGALKLLSQSVGSIMKMDEICSRPGAAPLRELFKDALGAQEAEVATAQVMLDVLQQFAAEVEEEEKHETAAPDTPGAVGQDDMEPPGSASGLEDLPRPDPDTSGAVSQEATSAGRDDEDPVTWEWDADGAEDRRPPDVAEDSIPPDVEMSNDFQQDVEKPVSASSDASWEQALLWQDARQEMLPSSLQPTVHSWTPESDAFRQMQAMKAREVEHVRWRAARPAVRDPELQCVEHAMRTAARRVIQTRVDLAELSGSPGSASVHPATFLNRMD